MSAQKKPRKRMKCAPQDDNKVYDDIVNEVERRVGKKPLRVLTDEERELYTAAVEKRAGASANERVSLTDELIEILIQERVKAEKAEKYEYKEA